MPIYSYRCRRCGHQFELLRAINEKDAVAECPDCGAKGPERCIMPFNACSAREKGGFRFG
jgi:putative FmdB family regulatory protein